MTQPPATQAEFVRLLGALPEPSLAARSAAADRNDRLTKPTGALGRLEALALWYCGWRSEARPADPLAQILVFAANHGVAARGVSAYPSAVTAQMVANFESGGAAINQLARLHGARLAIVPLELERPTADFCAAPALSAAELFTAVRAGWEAVDPEADVLLLGEMGIANTTAAAALCAALYGGDAAAWVGPGTGVSGDALRTKTDAVATALEAHRGAIAAGGPLEALRRLGGREIAALCGALLAARLRSQPVLLDGFVVGAAAAVLETLRPGALTHVQAAHVSAEPGHRALLDRLGLEPLLDLDLRLGEASGAATALGLLRAAIACQSGMASFEEASVSGRV